MSTSSVLPATESNWLPRFLRPPPPAVPLANPRVVRSHYRHYRIQILLWSTIGYAMFYYVRKNLSVAQPEIEKNLHILHTGMGLILTLHGVVYGISKFLNGMLADRANARLFMAIALLACAALNVGFGASSSIAFFALFWMINGWFQGMGYPPCARLLTHWFAPKELATKMSLWNASHVLGGGSIVLLCGFIIQASGNWRLCFYIPAIISALAGFCLLLFLRDTPESVGLPDVETVALTDVKDPAEPGPTELRAEEEAEFTQSPEDFKKFVKRQVFGNKYIWLASAANFFVYIIRFGIFDWGPTMLKESKGIALGNATWIIFSFEVAGLAGMLLTGWMTDRFFRGRAAPLCLISMLLCGLCVFLFWKTPPHAITRSTLCLMAAGFFVYTPQALIAVIVANQATKRAAATAVGLTSIFGYASTTLSGYGLGWLVQHYSWNHAFACLIASAFAGALLFTAVLPAAARGNPIK
jgi:OPA family glycerol-3-phosphate transporter-like MFS transporter/OPA family sugar phosphate sensor protein UhpC-like MFS transporter